jgi:hypothetical protein
VTLRSTRWSGALPRAILLAVVASLVPLPAMAAEEGSAPKPGVIKAAVSTIAVADAPAARATAARAARQSTPQRDASFFRSKPGILAVAVMAIGVGYALYSAREDRIKSPGKE